MARIKVTGFIETDDLDSDQVDLGHEMGLSSKGYEQMSSDLGMLDDVEFELEKP